MKTILGLGVRDPLVRVFVWLGGCLSLSIAGAAVGVLGVLAVAVLLVGAIAARMHGA